jgi:hypothetical protein
MSIGDYWERDSHPVPAEPSVQEPAPVMDTPPPQDIPPAEPQPPATPEKIMGKYDSVNDIVKAHQSLQTTYTKEHVALMELNKVVDQLKADKAALETKMNESSTMKPAEVQKDELEGLDAESVLSKFYEDPMRLLKKAEDKAYLRAEKSFNERIAQIEAKINPTIEAVETQKTQEIWDSSVREFAKDKPDVAEFKNDMAKYIQENGLENSKDPAKVLNDAYVYARGLRYQPQQAIDPKSLLSDETFVRENILNNPAIKEQFVKSYLAEIRGNQHTVPPTIAGNSSSNSVATPQPQPKSIREGVSRMADMIFGGR